MKKEKLNPGHWHEACDRTFCLCEIIDTMLLAHPAIKQTPELKKKVEEAQQILAEVYQLTGAKM